MYACMALYGCGHILVYCTFLLIIEPPPVVTKPPPTLSFNVPIIGMFILLDYATCFIKLTVAVIVVIVVIAATIILATIATYYRCIVRRQKNG